MKILVLLSGGLDSATCLAMAVEKVGAANVFALNILYGQKHIRELECAQKLSLKYGVSYQEMDLSSVLAFSDCSLLSHSHKKISHESYADQLKKLGGQGTVETYVPFRNGLFLSAAAAYALSVGADEIYYGAHADDAAGRAYPDCTPEFTAAMNQAIYEGSGHVLKCTAPLLNWNKAAVVREGLRLKVDYSMTWSCYEGGERPCGLCGTCRDRAAAFAANGIADPALEPSPVDKKSEERGE